MAETAEIAEAVPRLNKLQGFNYRLWILQEDEEFGLLGEAL